MSMTPAQAQALALEANAKKQEAITSACLEQVGIASSAGLYLTSVDYDLSGVAGYNISLAGYVVAPISASQYSISWVTSGPLPTPPTPYPWIWSVPFGGTGFASYAVGDLLYASGTATLSKLSAGAAGTVLRVAAGVPSWGTVAYSSLVLTGSIVNADIAGSAAIAYSKLALTGSIVNADISGSAAIIYSKLNLVGSVTNADLAGSIAVSKLVALTATKEVQTDGSGRLTTAADTGYRTVTAGAPGVVTIIPKTGGGSGQDNTSLTFPATGTLTTLAGTEALTNKDIDGGVAANTRRITIPRDTLANIQALTRKEGTVWYATDVDRLYSDDGANLNAVGAGSGAVNYCVNPDAETSTDGWAMYADATGTAPVDGTGGSPLSTWTRSAASPLVGLGSFVLTKSANDRRGEGVADAFTIDAADQAKQIAVSFNFITDVNYAAGDVLVYAVDVTNTRVIQLAPAGVQKCDVTGGTTYTGIFQSSADSVSYRLCFHIATVSALAYTLKVDRVSISPSAVVFAAPISDWEATTVTGSWTANTTYVARRRRVGDSEEYDVTATTSAAPTATSLTITLPAGRTIDTAKLSGVAPGAQALGYGSAIDTGVQQYPVVVLYISPSTTSVGVVAVNAAATYAGGANVTQAIPFTFGSTDTVQIRFIVPIAGWGTNVQVGGYDGRTVFARYTSSTTSITASTVTALFPTREQDTHNAYDPATGIFTAPVAGVYDVSVALGTVSASWTLGNLFVIAVTKNGTATSVLSTLKRLGTYTTTEGFSASLPVDLLAGDTLRVRAQTSITVALDGATTTVATFALRPGRSTLAVGDTVAFSVFKSTGNHPTSGSFLTVASWNTVTFDRTGSFNVTTGLFTAPVSGLYSIAAGLAFDGNSTGSRSFKLQKNGVDTAISVGNGWALTANPYFMPLAALVQLNAGDTINLQAFQSSGGALIYSALAAGQTYFSAVRVGN